MSSVQIDQIFKLYELHGNSDYIGENVSQIEHALQCAKLAEDQGYDSFVILGCFLHDVGHLLDDEHSPSPVKLMIRDGIDYGVENHELLGADYLRKLKVPEKICYFVQNHVAAKRYLVTRKKGYYEQLSEASKQTLTFQGGPMSETEADDFENQELFEAILKFRSWDELAKDTELNLARDAGARTQRLKEMLIKLIE